MFIHNNKYSISMTEITIDWGNINRKGVFILFFFRIQCLSGIFVAPGFSAPWSFQHLSQVGSICERTLSFTELHVNFLSLFVQGSENQLTLLHSFFVHWHNYCFLKSFFPLTYKGFLNVDSVFLTSLWSSSVTFSLLALSICMYIPACLFLWTAYLLYLLAKKEVYPLFIESHCLFL